MRMSLTLVHIREIVEIIAIYIEMMVTRLQCTMKYMEENHAIKGQHVLQVW